MSRFFRNNGLSIVLFALFFFSLLGQYLTGHQEYNEDQKQHGQPTVGYVEYLGEGHFIVGLYWEKRLNAAQRRFTHACMTLSRVRKLSRNTPALQFNIAAAGGQQVNVS